MYEEAENGVQCGIGSDGTWLNISQSHGLPHIQ